MHRSDPEIPGSNEQPANATSANKYNARNWMFFSDTFDLEARKGLGQTRARIGPAQVTLRPMVLTLRLGSIPAGRLCGMRTKS